MPVEIKCPYVAEWSAFSEEGQIIEKTLGPEDVLPLMVKGMTFSEIGAVLEAPMAAVSHAVAVIPDMMKWRDVVGGNQHVQDEELQILRDLQEEYQEPQMLVEGKRIDDAE